MQGIFADEGDAADGREAWNGGFSALAPIPDVVPLAGLEPARS